MSRPLTRILRPGLLAALGVALAVQVAASLGVFSRVETVWYDWRHRLAGVRHWPRHVALVVIDDAALNQYKNDPLAFWTPHLAKAAARLRAVGASVVGIDFLFSVSPEAWLARLLPSDSKVARTYDGPLRAEINSGRVVLVSSHLLDVTSGYDQLLMPDASFAMAVPDFDFAGHVGLANLTADADHVVRSFAVAPTLNLPPGTDPAMLPRYTLSPLLAARAAGLDRSQAEWELGGVRRPAGAELQRIIYSGPPGTIPRITLSRVLAEGAERDPLVQELSGKVVIIGGEFLSMGDTHVTPYGTGSEGAIMIGAEVQANIVETLLAGLEYRQFPVAGNAVLVLVFALLGAALWSVRRAWRGVGVAALLAVAAALSHYAFANFWLLPAVPPAAAALLAFGASALLAHSPARRHEAKLRARLGRHVGDDDIAWLVADGRPLPAGWEPFPAAVMALVLPPAGDGEAFEALTAALQEELSAAGATVSAGEAQMLLAYFGWPRPAANPCAEALAAVPRVVAVLRGRAVSVWGIGLHVGETAFRVAEGSLLATGESVAAAAGLAHEALGRDGRVLASEALLGAAAPEGKPRQSVLWQNGESRVAAAEIPT